MLTQRTTFGLAAEEAGCQWLAGRGYRILDRNWRRPWGELDIVAEHDGAVVFVEVKASAKQVEGFDPFLRAGGRKMHKVQRTAQTWLLQHRYGPDTEWQLDVLSIVMSPDGTTIEHFPNI
jgi:putative endonuclease